MDKEKDPLEKALIFIMYLIGIPSIIFTRSWVLMKMWGWFIVPLGFVTITQIHAIGLSLLLLTFKGRPSNRKEKEGWEELVDTYMYGILYPLFAVLVGWIFSFWM